MTVSELELPVMVTKPDCASVNVSVALSAATTVEPSGIAIFLNISPPPPGIVIVFVAPVPEAVTPEPTKFRVVADVDNAEPSSCTANEAAPAIVKVSPDKLVVTPPLPVTFKDSHDSN